MNLPEFCSKGHKYTEETLRFTTRKRIRKDGSVKISQIRYCNICNTEKNRKLRENNPKRAAELQTIRHKNLRQEALKAYGCKCVCCGETTPEFLHFDHVNNDGAIHRRELQNSSRGAGSYRVLYWAKKNEWPNTLQLKCHNCGMSEGYYGYCPHEKGDIT